MNIEWVVKVTTTIAEKAWERHRWGMYAVGGYVRDTRMGLTPKDMDIEVYGCYDTRELETFLREWGKVDTVGASFGVVKLTIPTGETFDFSLPRKDSKTGEGHKGFHVSLTESLTVMQAAARRDFTMNAMAIDLLTGQLYDPYGGANDIVSGTLRATTNRFLDDPLRVLRGMQFAGRFDMKATDITLWMMRAASKEFDTLPVERVWGEWEKWASKSQRPSAGLRLLRDSGWVRFFPELDALIGLGQHPAWHPEGDVWEHTLLACDMAARLTIPQTEERLVVMFAALLHDVGKATTTEFRDDGRITSIGHDTEGESIARAFMGRIGAPTKLTEKVVKLVRHHMYHIYVSTVSAKTARRLSIALLPATIREWEIVVRCDVGARPPMPSEPCENIKKIAQFAHSQKLEVKAPDPIIMGRHLIAEIGLEPGKHFGQILRDAYTAQIEGYFDNLDDGLDWVKDYIDDICYRRLFGKGE